MNGTRPKQAKLNRDTDMTKTAKTQRVLAKASDGKIT